MSGFYKGISGVSLFVSIPFLIKYLGQEDYGIWVLVFTLFQWILVMDFGIQSSLKTKIPVLFHQNEADLIKSYIKTTYKYAIYLAVFIFILFIISFLIFDIKLALNISKHSKNFVFILFIFNVFFFCINSVAGIHKSLYVAYLKGKYAEESIALYQLLSLLLIVIVYFLFPNLNIEKKLLLITFINGGTCLLVNLVYTIRFFKSEKINFKTTQKTPKEFIDEIKSIGLKFMAIQLGMMLFFTVDNYIISNNFSPKEVVPYDSVTKIFQLPVMILFAALSPLWSMFAKDYIEKNKDNLLQNFRKFNIYFIYITIFIFALFIICPFIIDLWITENLAIPKNLIMYIALVTLLRIFTSFYSYFLNGVGKLNVFIAIVVSSLVIKIPLTNFLISLGFGVNSVIIATLILLIIWVIIIPLESFKMVKKLTP